MEVRRKPAPYQPLTITVETPEEEKALRQLLQWSVGKLSLPDRNNRNQIRGVLCPNTCAYVERLEMLLYEMQ